MNRTADGAGIAKWLSVIVALAVLYFLSAPPVFYLTGANVALVHSPHETPIETLGTFYTVPYFEALRVPGLKNFLMGYSNWWGNILHPPVYDAGHE